MNDIIQKVIDNVKHQIPQAQVNVYNFTKNNGIVLHGLTILEEGKRMAPTIYLDDMLRDGLSVNEISTYVMSIYKNQTHPDEEAIISNVSNYDSIKNNLCLHLISKDMNQELLKSIPYKQFLDLAVIAVIQIDAFENGEASIKVNDNFLTMWDISFEKVFGQAYKNLLKEKTIITNIMDILKEYDCMDSISEDDFLPMYVMTNSTKLNGASRLLDEQALSEFTKTCGMDIAIIPSSIHETILVPLINGLDLDSLTKMVKDVNLTEVSLKEQLSDHAYIYRLDGGWSDYTNK